MEIDEVCQVLQVEQRNRVRFLKTRIRIENCRAADVAHWLGYKASDDEAERKKAWDAAKKLIKQIADNDDTSHPMYGLVQHSEQAIAGWEITIKQFDKNMQELASQLPVAAWCELPEQRGFGIASLAHVVGECGNLSNYANPGKVWRRMGCAPFTSKGKTLMGATWKSGKNGSLSADEWSQFGYSPRRRSVAYLIGKNLMMQNQTGPYRKRYDEVKKKAAETHADWKPLRCDSHARLLAVKLLLKNLWIEWNGKGGETGRVAEVDLAAIA